MAEALPSDGQSLMSRRVISPSEEQGQRDAKLGSNLSLRASLGSASDRRWCLRGIQITLLVRLAARMSSRSLASLHLVLFYPFSCAVVRLRRMAHCWRIRKRASFWA